MQARVRSGDRLWRIAAAGGGSALALLALMLANAGTLLEAVTPERGPVPAGAGPRAARAVLIVIDAVRADAAADPAVIPNLVRLARRGGSGVARTTSLMPLTISGIRALATGTLAPPLSFFQDFGAESAAEGGMFAAVRAAGRRSFVIGPQLWIDLYGRWIDGSVTVATVGSDDVFLLDAGLRALGRRDADLLVVHLGRCDEAAHRYGGRSAEYLDSLRWSDRALARLAERVPPDAALVVTSDHGVTTIGGHVGPERSVLDSPLVTAGPGVAQGALGVVPQTEVPRLVLGAIGLDLPPPVPAAPLRSSLPFLVVAGVALACALRIAVALAAGAALRTTGIAALVGLAAVLLAVVAGQPAVALWLALGALAAASWVSRPCAWAWPVGLLVMGGVFGTLRLLDGLAGTAGGGGARESAAALGGVVVALSGTTAFVVGRSALGRMASLWEERLPWGWMVVGAVLSALGFLLGGGALALILLAGFAAGAALGSLLRGGRGRAVTLGATLVFASVALSRALGENVSLSSTDVRAAYELIDGPMGIAAAGTVFAFRMALPTFALLAGAAPWLLRSTARLLGAFAAGASAALVGQIAGAGYVLSLADAEPAWTSLGVSGILRMAGELAFFFVGLTVVVLIGPRRLTRSPNAPPLRSRASPRPAPGSRR